MSRLSAEGGALRRRQHAALFAALGDETRLGLVSELAGGGAHSIARLTAGTRLTRQAVTKHLRVLEQAGLIRSARRGRESRFELEPQPVRELQEYLGRLSQQWDELLQRLKSHVES
jgi:DNA-binding transcriptional ArsR family regulator